MSKRTIIIAFAVVGVALLASYGLILRSVLHQRQQQAALRDQIAPLETALAEQGEGGRVLPTRRAELATVEAELAEARLGFPREIDSIEVLDYIVATASKREVELSHVEARDPLTTTVDTEIYHVFTYDVEVGGTLGAISSFLTDLESGSIETLTLDQIHVKAQPTPTSVYRTSLVVQVYVRP